MSGWLLVTLLASLFNTAALLYWQNANEKRMDAHWERLRDQQKQIKDILPMLNHVSNQLVAWEKWCAAQAATRESEERPQ